jgi:hypothetical protein
MAHATVRYSFPEDLKAERADIRAILETAGFDHVARAHWQATDVPLLDVLRAIQDVLGIVEHGQALNSLSVEVTDGPRS